MTEKEGKRKNGCKTIMKRPQRELCQQSNFTGIQAEG